MYGLTCVDKKKLFPYQKAYVQFIKLD